MYFKKPQSWSLKCNKLIQCIAPCWCHEASLQTLPQAVLPGEPSASAGLALSVWGGAERWGKAALPHGFMTRRTAGSMAGRDEGQHTSLSRLRMAATMLHELESAWSQLFFFLLCCLLGLSPKPPLFSNLSILAGWKMLTCMRKHRQKVKTSLVRAQTKLLYAWSDTNTRASTTPKRNGGGESHSQVQKEIQGNWE